MQTSEKKRIRRFAELAWERSRTHTAMVPVRLGLCLALMFLLGSTVAAEESGLDGLPIVAIHFDRYDVFDTANPKTSALLYRWANALHIISSERFIRANLLFEVGDPYSAALAAESARILRNLDLMNPVEITARKVEGGVEVTVETHDKWSMHVGGDFDSFGDRQEFGLKVTEENIAGWGKTVTIGYSSNDERDALSYRLFDPNVFLSRWRFDLAHANLTDGLLDRMVIDRPFYSLSTRWAWGGGLQRKDLVSHLYSEGESEVQGDRRSKSVGIWGGARLPGAGIHTRRLILGWQHQEVTYEDWLWEDDGRLYPPPDDRVIGGPRMAFQQVADRYLVVRGFRAWTVQEDVALGPNLSLSALFSSSDLGGDSTRLPFAGNFHLGRQWDSWLFLADGWASGRIEESSGKSMVAGIQLSTAQLGQRGWQSRLLVEESHELDADRQLTLGADVGLRGWNPDFFDGTGRALFNLQWRTLIKEDVLGLFSVGVLLFGDAGMTWDPRIGRDTDGVRLDGGIGLLFDLPRLGRNTLARIDLAFPDDGSGPTLSLTTSSIFRLPDGIREIF